MLPLLLKPKFLALRNYVIRSKFGPGEIVRDLVIAAFAATVATLIYLGTMWVIGKIGADPRFVLMPPSQPIGMMMMILLAMLMLSNLVAAMGALYLSSDLELLLASPLSRTRLFLGKLTYVTVSSSWMSLIFILPLITAFGVAYSAPIEYYLTASLMLVPYFLIPSGISTVLATLFVRLIPPQHLRLLVYVAGVLILAGILSVADLISEGLALNNDTAQLSRIISLLSAANSPALPSTWLAGLLQELLIPSPRGGLSYAVLLVCSAAAACSLGYILVAIFHFEAFSRTRNLNRGTMHTAAAPARQFVLMGTIFGPQHRAFMIKETNLFLREVTNIVQLLIMGSLCLIYLFNLRLFGGIQSLPPAMRQWWQMFFFVSNWMIGAFVVTGICTRFVFPSLSLEGRSIWILLSSPVRLYQVLHAKFACWYIPVALVAGGVFAAGAAAINAEPVLILYNVLSGFIVSYGVVGLAVGLGARFANFDWDHSSELAASFGSLVFMLSSVMLVLANVLVTWLFMFVAPRSSMHGVPISIGSWLFPILGFLFIGGINYLSAQICLREGARHLNPKEKI